MTGPKKVSGVELASFGGARFASSIFMAFSSYYLMAFYTDAALIPPAAIVALLLTMRLFGAAADQAVGVFINRASLKGGKYRPYFKWMALPFTASLVLLGLTLETSTAGKVIYAAVTLLVCELCWSVLNTAALSMLPYLAKGDTNRTRFVSFSHASSILAYIAVGTLMMPMVSFFGAGNKRLGFGLTLALFAIVALPLQFNAYFRLKERHYSDVPEKPAVRKLFLAIVRNKRVMLFFAGFCFYAMADSFKSQTTYYYMTFNMGRPDLLPVMIMLSLLSPLAVQPFIPWLLRFAGAKTLIAAGLFASSLVSLLMIVAGRNVTALAACIVLYGVFTAVTNNLVFTVLASFTDEIREHRKINMSEVLSSTMSLSARIGVAITSGAAPLALAVFGYSAQAAVQPDSALLGIKMLFIVCTAAGMALSGIVMLLFRFGKVTETAG
ncbi:MAG: MFS transporter [Firmicutes bacterium]|nr:MFS transporter [Bacillota bacterium]